MNIIKIFFLIFMPITVFSFEHEKKTMKILMIVSSFPKIHDICILNQITGLIDRGHDVSIYAFHQGDFENIQPEIITYDLIEKTIFGRLPKTLDDFDIVMFQLGHKLMDIRKSHNYTGKIVVCLRGYDITGFLQEKPQAYTEYFNTCDLFMPVCEFFKNILIQEGCSEDKIIVHHSSIDCSKFKFKKRRFVRGGSVNILSAGRYVEKKGFEYSIRAIARIVKKYPNIQYTIIGDGILKKRYQSLIERLGMEKNIILDNWHNHEEYVAIMDNTHIFLAPSVIAENYDQEGIPNVLKEAMAMGVLVVATNHAGIPELIKHNISGFLVPERNADELSKAIRYILEHPKKWTSLQLAAVQKIKQEFDKENETDKLEAILLNLVNEKIILHESDRK